MLPWEYPWPSEACTRDFQQWQRLLTQQEQVGMHQVWWCEPKGNLLHSEAPLVSMPPELSRRTSWTVKRENAKYVRTQFRLKWMNEFFNANHHLIVPLNILYVSNLEYIYQSSSNIPWLDFKWVYSDRLFICLLENEFQTLLFWLDWMNYYRVGNSDDWLT